MKRKMLQLLFKLHEQGALTTQQLCDIITEDNASEVVQQLPLPLKTLKTSARNYLDIQQYKDIVRMRVDGHGFATIAENMNVRYGLTLTPHAVKTILNKLKTGQQFPLKRCRSAAWQTALNAFQTELSSV